MDKYLGEAAADFVLGCDTGPLGSCKGSSKRPTARVHAADAHQGCFQRPAPAGRSARVVLLYPCGTEIDTVDAKQ